jgi:hypothetical protein
MDILRTLFHCGFEPFPATLKRLLALTGAMLCLGSQPVQAACPPPLQEPSVEQIQAAQRVAKDRGFLWEVSKSGRISYLYGTIHVAKLDWVFPGPQLVRAVQASDTMALELNLLDDATMQSIAQERTRLDEVPPPEAFRQWSKTKARELCLNAADLEKVRPEYQVMAITLAMARGYGLEPAFGIDAMLIQAGNKMGKAIEALETAEDQLRALRASNADIEESLARGDFTTEEFERGLQILVKLADAWAASDQTALDTYPQWCQCLNSAMERQEMQRMVDDRNPKMAARIEALHAAGHNLFVAVGSLHLIGEKGLPALLAQKGFAVKRIF